MGKCVAGTIGAPYEGYKGRMNVEFTPKLFERMLPNDDLDLQVLWLDVIEKVGPEFRSEDLAKAFYEKCPYSPGEYATFKKNYELGLRPPLTGKFNNDFYRCGMGCPIRSEIWACLAAWNPRLAAELAAKDGVLDHDGDSVVAEQYMAALEAMAFNDRHSVRELIVKALDYIDKNSEFYKLVGRVIEWCDKYGDVDSVFSRVIRDYGHSDCTNMYQNMAIVISALLLGKEDFTSTVMLALNCGFDTDCTCATVGSVLGIKIGGSGIREKYTIPDQEYKLGVNITRPTSSVYDLSVDVAKTAVLFKERNRRFNVSDIPEDVPTRISPELRFPVRAEFTYVDGEYTVRPGDQRQIKLKLVPYYNMKDRGTVTLTAPEGFTVKPDKLNFKLGFLQQTLSFTVSVAKDIPVLMEKNIIKAKVTLEKGDSYEFEVGLVGDKIWKVFGPFWENTSYVAPPIALESYYAGLPAAQSESEGMTITRQFHLNMKADWNKEYLEDQLLGELPLSDKLLNDPKYQGFTAYFSNDKFCFEDFMSNTMPCIVYLVRDIYVAEDTVACLQVGHSDKYKLWINGDLMADSDDPEHWTPENLHRKNILLKKGSNRTVLKLARTSGVTDFSMIFTKGGACTDHLTSLGSGTVI